MVTKSGLISIGATPDMKFRAHDTRDGSILWETELTAAAFSTPAVYRVDGKQYVAIAAGGGRMDRRPGRSTSRSAFPRRPTRVWCADVHVRNRFGHWATNTVQSSRHRRSTWPKPASRSSWRFVWKLSVTS